MAVADRLPRLVERLDGAGCDALLVSARANIRYLCGFSGSAGLLLVGRDLTLLVTDGRYTSQAAEQLEAAGVTADVETGNPERQRELLAKAASSCRRVGLEAAAVTWAHQRAYATEVFPEAELVATEGLVEDLRKTKDEGELARIARAAGIADAALHATARRLLDAPTEREFGIELDHTMRRLGADDVSFETIVASGPNGAKPHARPTDRRIAPGELVVVDFGALVDGYHSDMTRTLCVGDPASPDAARVAALVTEAQAAGVAAVRAGVRAADVDAACREIIAAAGHGDAFVHGTGHGVGLDIHESPILNATATATLDAGFVVTVEPGVYLPGEFGSRVEDSVVVGDDGCRRLTNAPKELVIT